MNIPKILLLLVLCACASYGQKSNDISDLFAKGNEYYSKNNYDSALTMYQSLLQRGIENSDVYYNLANTFVRLNSIGKAILYYEKALALSPTDKDIENNLAFARKLTIDKIPETQPSALTSTLLFFHTILSLNTQLYMLLAAFFLLSIIFAYALFCQHNLRIWLIFLMILILFSISAVALSAGIKIYKNETTSFGIILTEQTDAKNGPQGTKTLFTLHEGTKVQIQKSMDTWSLITLSNGASGWIESNAIGKL